VIISPQERSIVIGGEYRFCLFTYYVSDDGRKCFVNSERWRGTQRVSEIIQVKYGRECGGSERMKWIKKNFENNIIINIKKKLN
jgi:hypothetical protein